MRKEGDERSALCLSFQEQHLSECCTYQFYQLPIVQQRLLVLDLIALLPCLDLIPQSLQLLDLRLEILLHLLLLSLICRGLHLLICSLEQLYSFCYLLQRPIDLGWGGRGEKMGVSIMLIQTGRHKGARSSLNAVLPELGYLELLGRYAIGSALASSLNQASG